MNPENTCWTLIEAAADGNAGERDAFARRYLGPVEAYLGARWSGNRLLQERDDAVQEVFFEFFRDGGVLKRTARGAPGGFRALLYGVARNVARRVETRRTNSKERQLGTVADLDAIVGDEATLSGAFDREWAISLMRQAFETQTRHAKLEGERALKRVELLQLRFQDGLPIRKIAERWQIEAATVHEEYRRARAEFKKSLFEVVSYHHPDTPHEAEKECTHLLALLSR